jgi:uncharacterized protein involved in outer membrane biogenesis
MQRWQRLALWFTTSLVVIIAGAAAWLWTADLGMFRPQIEQFVGNLTGRALQIDELSIDLGNRSTAVARGVRFQNAAWAAEPEMVVVERIEVQLDLWSLFGGPVILHRVDVDGASAFLTRPEDGEPNWVLGAHPESAATATDDSGSIDILVGEITLDDARVIFDSPERTGPVDLRVDSLRQRRRADDFLELVAAGSIGGRAISIQGELGTWQSLLSGEDIRYSLAGGFDSFSMESAGVIDSLSDLRRPSLTFSARGPDINDLLEIAGVEGTGEGDVDLTGSLAADGASPLELSVEGNLGRLEIDANGSFSDLRNFGELDMEVLASGPDLSRILRLFGVQGVGESPFMLDLDAERKGSQVVIERGRMLFAEAEFTATAEIPNFPSVDDANIRLLVEGPDLARFREILNLPGAASGAFLIQADLETTADGIEVANMVVETSLGRLEARGTLGEEPGLVGTEMRFDLQSPSLANLAGHYGLPRLPEEPVEISGSAALQSEGIRTRGPLVVKVADITFTVDGLLRTVRGLYGSRLDYGLEGPDLAAFVGAFTESSWIPSGPFLFNGVLDIREDGFRFENASGQLRDSELALDGLLRPVPGIAGSRFELTASGSEINEILPDAVDLEIRPGPYSLSAALTFSDETIDLENLRLSREGGSLDLDLTIGRAERRIGFAVDAEGRDIRAVLSRFQGIEAEEAPFTLDTRGEFRDSRLSLADLDIAIGNATIDASGDLDFSKNARSTRFRFDLDIPNLARIGMVRGHRMRPQALALDATVDGRGGVLTIDDAIARLDDSEIRGSFRLTTGSPPKLDVEISSDSLVLVSPLEESAEPPDPEPKFEDGRLIPDLPLPLDTLKKLDASVSVDIADLMRTDRHFRNVALRAVLADGALELSRFGFDAPSGRIDARARLAPTDASALLELEIAADDFATGLAKSNVELDMTANLQLNLSATGTNLRELAASANGIVLVDTRGGQAANIRILQALYGDMLEEILSVINPFYTAEPNAAFECIILPIEIEAGSLSSAPNALIMTDKVRIVTTAKIDLGKEALDLAFRTTPRRGVVISAGEILNPFVKVVGTLAEPRLAVDEQGILITGGAAVATGGLSILAKAAWDRLNRSRDPCGDMSKQAYDNLADRFPDIATGAVN